MAATAKQAETVGNHQHHTYTHHRLHAVTMCSTCHEPCAALPRAISVSNSAVTEWSVCGERADGRSSPALYSSMYLRRRGASPGGYCYTMSTRRSHNEHPVNPSGDHTLSAYFTFTGRKRGGQRGADVVVGW